VSTTPADPLAPLLNALCERVALRVTEMVLARLEAQAAPQRPATGLVEKREAAVALHVSRATLDRFVRAGAPVHRVGARRRFDVTELRAWLETRGRRPAAPRSIRREPVVDDVEIDEIAAASGLRRRR
jgi:excisionase family DNA binding protein